MRFSLPLLAGFLTLISCKAQAQDRPNFIFILTDDLGFGDLPLAYKHPYAETPNIDRIAREGTSFRQFNVNANICQPTRAGLMTSRNPSWFPNYTKEFGLMGATTVTKLLKDAGYLTGHIGKWHIGGDPEKEAVEYGIDDLRLTGSTMGDPRGREGKRFDDTLDFLETHKDETFYLNLWVWSPHSIVDPPQSFIDHFEGLTVDRNLFGSYMQAKFDEIEANGGNIDEAMRIYLGEVYAFDIQVGRLLDKLDELELTEKTVVVFMSDNGPAPAEVGNQYIGSSGGLRGEKHSFYEGGMRVPFIVRWPGKVPAGCVDDSSIMFGLDWLPSVCTLAGASIPWDFIEGEDMSDVWLGNSRSRKNPLFYRGLRRHNLVYMRYGKWKLHKKEEELYDLDVDPEERVNLYAGNPEVVGALLESMEAWEATLPDVHVRKPDDAAPFDPTVPAPEIILPDLSEFSPSPVEPTTMEPTLLCPTDSLLAPSGAPSMSDGPPSVPIASPTAPPQVPEDDSLAPTVTRVDPGEKPIAPSTAPVGPSSNSKATGNFTALFISVIVVAFLY